MPFSLPALFCRRLFSLFRQSLWAPLAADCFLRYLHTLLAGVFAPAVAMLIFTMPIDYADKMIRRFAPYIFLRRLLRWLRHLIALDYGAAAAATRRHATVTRYATAREACTCCSRCRQLLIACHRSISFSRFSSAAFKIVIGRHCLHAFRRLLHPARHTTSMVAFDHAALLIEPACSPPAFHRPPVTSCRQFCQPNLYFHFFRFILPRQFRRLCRAIVADVSPFHASPPSCHMPRPPWYLLACFQTYFEALISYYFFHACLFVPLKRRAIRLVVNIMPAFSRQLIYFRCFTPPASELRRFRLIYRLIILSPSAVFYYFLSVSSVRYAFILIFSVMATTMIFLSSLFAIFITLLRFFIDVTPHCFFFFRHISPALRFFAMLTTLFAIFDAAAFAIFPIYDASDLLYLHRRAASSTLRRCYFPPLILIFWYLMLFVHFIRFLHVLRWCLHACWDVAELLFHIIFCYFICFLLHLPLFLLFYAAFIYMIFLKHFSDYFHVLFSVIFIYIMVYTSDIDISYLFALLYVCLSLSDAYEIIIYIISA